MHGTLNVNVGQGISLYKFSLYEFDAEFDVGSLLQFHVHAEIANVTKQGGD
jgi:hypothetical protein